MWVHGVNRFRNTCRLFLLTKKKKKKEAGGGGGGGGGGWRGMAFCLMKPSEFYMANGNVAQMISLQFFAIKCFKIWPIAKKTNGVIVSTLVVTNVLLKFGSMHLFETALFEYCRRSSILKVAVPCGSESRKIQSKQFNISQITKKYIAYFH